MNKPSSKKTPFSFLQKIFGANLIAYRPSKKKKVCYYKFEGHSEDAQSKTMGKCVNPDDTYDNKYRSVISKVCKGPYMRKYGWEPCQNAVNGLTKLKCGTKACRNTQKKFLENGTRALDLFRNPFEKYPSEYIEAQDLKANSRTPWPTIGFYTK
jgi:hypothetical protein